MFKVVYLKMFWELVILPTYKVVTQNLVQVLLNTIAQKYLG